MTKSTDPPSPTPQVAPSPGPAVLAPVKFRYLVLTPAPAGGNHSATVKDYEYADVIGTANEKSTALQLEESAAFHVEAGLETLTDPSGGEIVLECEVHRGSAALYRLYDKTNNQWIAVLGLLTESLSDGDNKYVHGTTLVELDTPHYPTEVDDIFRPLSILVFQNSILGQTPTGSVADGLAKVASAVFFRYVGRL